MKKRINQVIKYQKSLQFYKKIQVALKEVLSKMPDKDYKTATSNLIIVALHEGALGQVMHFENKNKFQVMQLIFPKNIPMPVLKFVLAHELGHVLQGRNWKKSDNNNLELDAENYAESIGFKRTKEIKIWMKDYAKKFGANF